MSSALEQPCKCYSIFGNTAHQVSFLHCQSTPCPSRPKLQNPILMHVQLCINLYPHCAHIPDSNCSACWSKFHELRYSKICIVIAAETAPRLTSQNTEWLSRLPQQFRNCFVTTQSPALNLTDISQVFGQWMAHHHHRQSRLGRASQAAHHVCCGINGDSQFSQISIWSAGHMGSHSACAH